MITLSLGISTTTQVFHKENKSAETKKESAPTTSTSTTISCEWGGKKYNNAKESNKKYNHEHIESPGE